MWNASFISPIWRLCWNCCVSNMAPLFRFQNHSHPDDLANHIDFRRVLKRAQWQLRRRMRLHQQLATHDRAPAAQISAAMLQKIDRPLKLICPSAGGDFSPAFVNRDQRAGLQYGIHGPIFQANKAVAILAYIETGQNAERHLSPALNQMTEKRGAGQVDFEFQRLRHAYRSGV